MTLRISTHAASVLLLAAHLAACGPKTSGQPAESGDAQGSPENSADIDAMLQREAGELTAQPIKSPDAAWTAEVVAAAPAAVQSTEDVVVIDIPIGSETPVRCQVFPETVDPGGTLANILAESSKKVQYVRLMPAGIHVVAGAPAAYLDTIYTVESEQGKAAGNLKLAFHAREPQSILCLHDEAGYRATFERVSKSLFASFKLKRAQPSKQTFLDVSKTTLEGIDVGFGITQVMPGEQPGERSYVYRGTTFLPSSPSDLGIEDSYNVMQIDAKGKIRKAVWVDAGGGELTMQILITPAANGAYAYEGQLSGKPVKGELAAKQGIATPLDVAALLKKKLKGNQAFSEVQHEYHPSIDPTATVPVTYSREASAPAREVKVKIGDQQFTVVVDAQGFFESGMFPVGNKTLKISREHSEGKL